MGYAPVAGPLPVPANVGLRAARGSGSAVTENPDPPGTRWLGGYRFQRGPCNCGTLRDICDVTTPHVSGENLPWREARPFLVGCARTCSTFGWEATQVDTEVSLSLDLVQYDQIARELWRGDFARANGYPTPYLADGSDEFVDLMAENDAAEGEGFDFVEGLAALEDALATCHSGMGLIHAPVIMAARWSSRNLLIREGRRYFTYAGNQVDLRPRLRRSGPVGSTRTVTDAGTTNTDATLTSAAADFTADDVGAGISGAGIPASTTILSVTNESTVEMSANATATATGVTVIITADEPVDPSLAGVWVYATGPLQIRLDTGPPTVTPTAGNLAEAVDRGVNDITYIAERPASAVWGCCHIGARLVRCGTCC